MVIDGQFGSTGKGLAASRIAMDNEIHIVVSTLSPNAGHTFYIGKEKYVSKHVPVSAILQKNTTIFVAAGSVINTQELLKEMDVFGIDRNRIKIHPRAAVSTPHDIEMERIPGGIMQEISSTMSGTGRARAKKILREGVLAMHDAKLSEFISVVDLEKECEKGAKVFVETGQGVGLGLNFGFAYPYCTSRDLLPSCVLADCGVHPLFMGNSMLVFRTYPIRVGNIEENNEIIGTSGPFYPDSKECTWEELGVVPERTTVTGRIRRVASFSKIQYTEVVNKVRPTEILLNFVNYLREEDFHDDRFNFYGIRKPSLIGRGPKAEDIEKYTENALRKHLERQ